MTTHIAIDVGTGFADVVAHHYDAQGERGSLNVSKAKTLHVGIGPNLIAALQRSGVALSDASLIVIGTTLPDEASAAAACAQALQQVAGSGKFRGSVYFMQGNAGLAAAGADADTLFASGAVGGMLAARLLGNLIGEKNVLAVDVGAGTAKCTLIREGNLPVKQWPSTMDIDITSIDIGTNQDASGVLGQANAQIASRLRAHCARYGFEARDCALMAFGGGGGLHAVGLAQDLGIARIIIPVNAATFSAWGMLLADIRRDYTQVHPMGSMALCAAAAVSVFEQLRTEAQQHFRANGLAQDDWRFEYHLHFNGEAQDQSFKLAVDQGSLSDAMATFLALHVANATCHQLVFHLVANSNVTKPKLQIKTSTGRAITNAKLGERMADFERFGNFFAEVYDGNQLEPGDHLSGPAVVQGRDCVVSIPPHYDLTVDSYCNYIIEQSEAQAQFGGDAVGERHAR